MVRSQPIIALKAFAFLPGLPGDAFKTPAISCFCRWRLSDFGESRTFLSFRSPISQPRQPNHELFELPDLVCSTILRTEKKQQRSA